MIQIPLFQTTSADFVQTIELENRLVTIRLTWNIRNESFYFTFTDADGNTIDGIRIVEEWTLLKYHKGSIIVFTGDLMARKIDESASDEITYDNFGSGWGLFYMTQAEIQAWEESNGLG